MLGQVANYCPVIARNTIVKNSTSMRAIWQAIRAHYVEDNLLTANGNIRHHGEDVSTDEELTPSLENIIVLTWLRLIHADLPTLVKQRYGTEPLRSQTLASLKPEISQALDALLDEIHSSNEAKVLRTAFRRSSQQRDNRSTSSQPSNNKGGATKCCPICKQAKRSQFQHYLSKCPFLPNEDRQYLTRTRQVIVDQHEPSDKSDSVPEPDDQSCFKNNRVSQVYRLPS